MNRYYLRNWSNKEEKEIEAIAWEIDNYQHTFYSLNDGEKVITQSYNTRYYTVTFVEYKIN